MESGKVTSPSLSFCLLFAFYFSTRSALPVFTPLLFHLFFSAISPPSRRNPTGHLAVLSHVLAPRTLPVTQGRPVFFPPRLQMRKRSCTEIPAHSYTQQLRIQTQARLTPESQLSPHHRVWGGCAQLGGAESNLPSGSHKKGEVAKGSANTWHFLPLVCMLPAAGWPRQHRGPRAKPEATKPDASAKSLAVCGVCGCFAEHSW